MIFKNIQNEKGFVLAEFVIALPLLILLIYTLANIFLNATKYAEKQAADYVLEEEAQEILERIKKDARAASEVCLSKDGERQDLTLFGEKSPTSTSGGMNRHFFIDKARNLK